MSTPVLHYIYDPLCGWCYGAAPLVAAARAIVTVRPHGGGMMAGAGRQAVTPQLRDYVTPHDHRIAALTGQVFGDAYRDGLLRDTTAVFDSEPPITAMLAAEQVAGRGVDMIERLQVAHYVEGQRIAETPVLLAVAAAMGLDPTAFADTLAAQTGDAVQRHIRDTRQFMRRVGAGGFPSFVLETGDSRQLLDLSAFLGRPDALTDWLRTTLAA
ncbi:DsbA family protein [Dechloromonas sp. XY25]|uniref:DsbA family protein n=1 Tax=Dechloromonas hankyongensis TaxID=2908002 RepID=A0ABS9K7U0_9RHOO|nr:DsbA family protein [Dechloromonas hankyongensis]MCG2579144.1 DsbA family protein [Dechloromonas hankyongensis]